MKRWPSATERRTLYSGGKDARTNTCKILKMVIECESEIEVIMCSKHAFSYTWWWWW